MGKLSTEDLKELAEALGPIIAKSVEISLDNHRTKYDVDNEIHYQDHMMMAVCRKSYQDRLETHRLVADLNEDDNLEKAVRFSNKLEKRETLIVKTATRVGVGTIVVAGVTYAKDFMDFVMNYIRSVPPSP